MVIKDMAYKAYTRDSIHKLSQFQALPANMQRDIQVVSTVFPFRTNRYVVEQLINWDNVPNDPIYQLTFPQHDMLSPANYKQIAALIEAGDKQVLKAAVHQIQLEHNPPPCRTKNL